MDKIIKYLNYMSIHKVIKIKPEELRFEEQVRDACKENKCGRYQQNFMCPPHVGTIASQQEELNNYNRGLLIYLKEAIADSSDQELYYQSADRLHEIILGAERTAQTWGYEQVKGYIAGHCRLCDPCGAEVGLQCCIRPDEARTSMEAIGIDVLKTCDAFGEPIVFNENEVTWVGMLLLRD